MAWRVAAGGKVVLLKLLQKSIIVGDPGHQEDRPHPPRLRPPPTSPSSSSPDVGGDSYRRLFF